MDMNTYDSEDYRNIIRDKLESRKKINPSITFSAMADFMRVQKPYISKVINGSADFNSDQLYKVVKFLEFDEEEHQYLGLLIEREKTLHQDRRKDLSQKISKIQRDKRDTGKRNKDVTIMTTQEFDGSDFVEFYLDPMVSIVHIFLSIPKFRKDLNLIKSTLNLDDDRLSNILNKMEKLDVIAIKKDGVIELLQPQIHLPADSNIVIPHQKLMSQLILHKKGDMPFSKKKSFMATFAANKKVQEQIEIEFNKFLDKAQQMAMKSKATDVFQISFDLFPWS